jgi:hypothetical protein
MQLKMQTRNCTSRLEAFYEELSYINADIEAAGGKVALVSNINDDS